LRRKLVGTLSALALLAAAAASPARAQQATIAGTVTAEATGRPVPGVRVTAEGTRAAAQTDSAGRYTLTGLSGGTYTLTAQSAGYAGGLKPDKLKQQHAEVDAVNKELNGKFKIFKSIESDILMSGKLDYPDEILATFDLVIASIHAGQKMSEPQGTARLIKAIENPYTTILGHPTGRLLLRRPGYPIDHEKVIDACAANNVVLEINANPNRLDVDWTWVWYAMERGLMLAVNPDAHNINGLHDVRFGLHAARKGGLVRKHLLNALSLDAFEVFLQQQLKKR